MRAIGVVDPERSLLLHGDIRVPLESNESGAGVLASARAGIYRRTREEPWARPDVCFSFPASVARGGSRTRMNLQHLGHDPGCGHRFRQVVGCQRVIGETRNLRVSRWGASVHGWKRSWDGPGHGGLHLAPGFGRISRGEPEPNWAARNRGDRGGYPKPGRSGVDKLGQGRLCARLEKRARPGPWAASAMSLEFELGPQGPLEWAALREGWRRSHAVGSPNSLGPWASFAGAPGAPQTPDGNFAAVRRRAAADKVAGLSGLSGLSGLGLRWRKGPWLPSTGCEGGAPRAPTAMGWARGGHVAFGGALRSGLGRVRIIPVGDGPPEMGRRRWAR